MPSRFKTFAAALILAILLVAPRAHAASTNFAELLSLLGRFFGITQVAQVAPTSGLIGLWSFEENTGTAAADSSGTGNNGTLSGSTWTPGIMGTALSNSAAARNYVNIGSLGSFGSQIGSGFSVAFWAKPNGWTAPMNVMGVMNGVSPTSNEFRIAINHDMWGGYTAGAVYAGITSSDSKPLAGATSGGLVPVGSWTHVTITVNPATNTIEVYINGVKNGVTYATQGTPSSFANFTRPFLLGALNDGSIAQSFDGALDDVRIYNRILTPSEINTIYSLPGALSNTGSGPDTVPPFRTNATPTGTLAAGTTQITLSLNTNENATCKYETSAGVAYGSMSKSFASTGGIVHTTAISNLAAGSYSYFVRCQDGAGNADTDDYTISFSIDKSAIPITILPPNQSPYSCGNNRTEPGEACDGSDVNGLTCSSAVPGYTSGGLTCKSDCSGYNFSSCVAGGRKITAASCGQVDVQTAINSAIDGDIVIIPAGSCTWKTLVAGRPAVDVTKSIVLKGAGIDQTYITDQTDNTVGATVIQLEAVKGKPPVRLTGLTIERWIETYDASESELVNVMGGGDNWRIDNVKFIALGTDGIIYSPYNNRGIIDHIQAYGSTRILIEPRYNRDGQQLLGNDEHKLPLALGTGNAVFIESSIFDSTAHGQALFGDAIDGTAGLRYVIRNNKITDKLIETHGVQWSRGMMSYEIYNNDLYKGSTDWVAIAMRSGTGVIFNNISHGFRWGANIINLYNDRSEGIGFFGVCDGTSVADGNTPGMNGYPCLDQIGYSRDGGAGDGTTGGAKPQISDPLYEWNNYDDQDNSDTQMVVHGSMPFGGAQIKVNRDFFNNTVKPGYVPYPYPHPLTLADASTGVVTSAPPPTSYSLFVTNTKLNSAGGTVTSSIGGINCGSICSTTLSSGTSVTLTATAVAGSNFTGWSGACSGTSLTCTVTLSSNLSAVATFNTGTVVQPTSYQLSVAKLGTGTGTVSGSGIVCPVSCSASFTSGSVVTLTAAPATGSTFAGWSGACTGMGLTCTVTVTNNLAVTATFNTTTVVQAPTTYTLSVIKSGTGSGTISGGSISCGTGCSQTSNSGASVTLTASANSGSTFAGWGGACTGTGSCSVTLSADTLVSAIFNTVADTLPPDRSNGQPSGTLPYTTAVTLSLNTNENATCRYSTVSGQPIANMTLFGSTGGTTHTSGVSGLSNGNYVYYVKCQDSAGNVNPTDYALIFAIAQKAPLIIDTSAPTVEITKPLAGETYTTGRLTLLASASDNAVVAGVTFFVDDVQVGPEDAVASYGVNWKASVGAHTITAKARDNSGNTSTSKPVTVTIVPSLKVQTAKAGSTTGGTGGTNTIIYSSSSLDPLSVDVAAPTDVAAELLSVKNAPVIPKASVTKPAGGAKTLAPSVQYRTFKFTRTLQLNSKGEDVRALQQFLNTHGFAVAGKGVGSRGYETTLFGPGTKNALTRYQRANRIIPATGTFGPLTRARVNAQFGK